MIPPVPLDLVHLMLDVLGLREPRILGEIHDFRSFQSFRHLQSLLGARELDQINQGGLGHVVDGVDGVEDGVDGLGLDEIGLQEFWAKFSIFGVFRVLDTC